MDENRLQELSDKVNAGEATEKEEQEFLDLYVQFLKGIDEEIKINDLKADLQA